MTPSAVQQGSGGGLFLLFWSIFAIAGGGTLATRKWSTRYKSFIVENLEPRPLSQQRADRMPAGFFRFIGGLFAVIGVVCFVIAVVLISRG